MRRLLLMPAFAAVILCVSAPGASAESRTLHIDQPLMRDCAAELLPAGAPGSASEAWRAPSSGMLTARLEGDLLPDWDLVLFRNGEAKGASTNFGSIEQATIWVDAGDRVVAQACRRDGHRAEVPLRFDLYAEPRPTPSTERFSMESVPISGPEDLQRLNQLGLDVTEDISPGRATVAAYSDAQRALLAQAGFSTQTLIPDLVANDAAARRAERRASARASGLPTGRESYRVYTDFTNELKALAQANPSIAREVNLSPTADTRTIEQRPIQGIEIATDVLRQDDGRPVYLNFGEHHAREWPSGEWPMEFAHSLVDGYNANDPRIHDLLDDVRIVIVPVVNVDGFIAARSFGTSPLDDDPDATLAQSVANQGAYIRKNCRPTTPPDMAIPCAQRTGSGVDLNRNYGYYWGGPGSEGMNTTSQSYRGTDPFSEPETEAVHRYTSSIQPTVFITNHTFTDDGKWLRQPGFDADFLPQQFFAGYDDNCGMGDMGAITPDETAMKSLGDAMAAATGFTSETGYQTLCDITGATEDWNYFAQGTYGYTPEARGVNFHPNYADGVVTEYLGDATHTGQGVREAYIRAGERAANPADHGIIQGTVPPGATLKLTKDFEAPTFDQPAKNVDEHLETTLKGSADGTYEWHVNPSDRPAVSGGPTPNPTDEVWTMTCQRPGQSVFSTTVEVTRGQTVAVNWAGACGADPPVNTPPVAAFDVSPIAPLAGQQVNFISISADPDGAIATTDWDLDDDGQFDDASGLVASRSFPVAGNYPIAVRVTDNNGAPDVETRSVVVTSPAQATQPPAATQTPGALCRGRPATIVGTSGKDKLTGTPNVDVITGRGGADRVRALAGADLVCGGGGPDRLSGGGGADLLSGGAGPDLLIGGAGPDQCLGGKGEDVTHRCG